MLSSYKINFKFFLQEPVFEGVFRLRNDLPRYQRGIDSKCILNDFATFDYRTIYRYLITNDFKIYVGFPVGLYWVEFVKN